MSRTVHWFDNEVDTLARRLERERTHRNKVEDSLGRALLDHNAQVGLLHDVYREASAVLPAIELASYASCSAFNKLKLSHLVPFFLHLAGELTHIRVEMKGALLLP